MQGHRLLRGVGILLIIVAVVYLLGALGGALWLGNRGVGSGWGTGWTGWLTIPFAGGAIFAGLMLLVFGLMLFFLAKIDDNLALAERRRMEAATRPRVEPSVAARPVEAPVAAVAATEAAIDAPPAVAAVAAAAAVAAVADEQPAAGEAPWVAPVAAEDILIEEPEIPGRD